MYWYKLFAIAALLLATTIPAYADDGGSYALPCESFESLYDPGKTPEGFDATATDGCHSVHWTSNTTDTGPQSGTYTFKTVGNVPTWEWNGRLPGPEGGDANRCRHYAISDANMIFTNRFGVPVGTEVTVKYRCY